MNKLNEALKELIRLTVREEVGLLIPQEPLKELPTCVGVAGACEITGYKAPTIYKLVNERLIPFYKSGANGRKLTFKREELEAWMTAKRVGTTAEFVAERMGAQ